MPMCKFEGCLVKSAVFNYPGCRSAVYCAAHKQDGMVDVKNKTCIHPGCRTIPYYNLAGEKRGLYCAAHKQDGMVDVKSKTCIHPGCRTIPHYNLVGEKQAVYCVAHKQDGMVDVKHKTCIHPGCITQPYYNLVGEKQAVYCVAHKQDGMVDVKSKTCSNAWCDTRVGKKYDGYCLYCFVNMFPDKPVSRNYKTKERSVAEFIVSSFSEYDWKIDQRVYDGCSKRRPDLLLDMAYQVVIVEIDEHQHADYECSCENRRTMELSRDLGHRPIVFIRFNPDSYLSSSGAPVPSCWGINRHGVCAIKRSKQAEWTARLACLSDAIIYWTTESHRCTKMVEIIELFYDGFEPLDATNGAK